jgi:hypothetical protein
VHGAEAPDVPRRHDQVVVGAAGREAGGVEAAAQPDDVLDDVAGVVGVGEHGVGHGVKVGARVRPS